MTPQEKASDLVRSFYDKIEDVESVDDKGWSSNSYLLEYSVKLASKQCALIAVDEILKTFDCTTPHQVEYWQEVKQEIEKL
jgi:hypothetical protein